MSSPKQWWRRAAAAAKDQGSLYWSRISRHRSHHYTRSQEVEAAIIRATSHDDRCVDYKYAGRIFAWARAAPAAYLHPLVWSVARRVGRTRSWVVALKALLIAHGLLLCSDDAPSAARLGRLPFDLSDFKDRSTASGADASGFSAFVRAYFRFLDRRSLFAAVKPLKGAAFKASAASPSSYGSSPKVEPSPEDEDTDEDLRRLERLQILLDLLMQIRPYADGMDVRLVLEAMDCVVIEIFQVYSGICNGIAQFLVGVFGSDPKGGAGAGAGGGGGGGGEDARRRGAIGMRILRRATVQSSQLSAYFDVCRAMGVLNATEFPPVEQIPDDDINDLEQLMLGGVPAIKAESLAVEKTPPPPQVEEKKSPALPSPEAADGKLGTVVITNEWVKFEEEGMHGHFGNPFLSPKKSVAPLALVAATAETTWTMPTLWAGMVNAGRGGGVPAPMGDLIELI